MAGVSSTFALWQALKSTFVPEDRAPLSMPWSDHKALVALRRGLVEISHGEIPAVGHDNASALSRHPGEDKDGAGGRSGRMAIDRRVLRMPAVMERTGLSKASIYRLIHADDFPAAIRLSSRAVGWPAQQIDEWVASRERVRGDSGSRGARRR